MNLYYFFKNNLCRREDLFEVEETLNDIGRNDKNIGKNDKYLAIKRGLDLEELVLERRTNDPSSVCKQCEITENNNEQIVERTGLCGQER